LTSMGIRRIRVIEYAGFCAGRRRPRRRGTRGVPGAIGEGHAAPLEGLEFVNFNLNKSPAALNYFSAVSWTALGVWSPGPQLVVYGGVFDPNSRADNFADHAFDTVNLYLTSIALEPALGLRLVGPVEGRCKLTGKASNRVRH
jgi:hypothetical protein